MHREFFEPGGQSSLNFAVGPDTRWHLSVSPTLLRSYPTGQVRRKEKGCHYISVSKTYLDLLLATELGNSVIVGAMASYGGSSPASTFTSTFVQASSGVMSARNATA